jgi:hypothetical protein
MLAMNGDILRSVFVVKSNHIEEAFNIIETLYKIFKKYQGL